MKKLFYNEEDYNVFKISPRDNDDRDADTLFNEFINSNPILILQKSHRAWAIRVYRTDIGSYVVLSTRGEKLEEIDRYTWNHYIYIHDNEKDAIKVAKFFNHNVQEIANREKEVMLNGKGTSETSTSQDNPE